MNIEECFTDICEKVALVRYVTSCATVNPEIPDPSVLAGAGSLCSEIEVMARAVKDVVGVSALGIELNRRHRVRLK